MAETKIGRVLIVEDEPLEQIALCGNVKKIYQDKLEISDGRGWDRGIKGYARKENRTLRW